MASRKSAPSSAPIAAETGTDVLGTAQDTAMPPAAVSDPSGLNGPDGTIREGEVLSTHTPESESGSVVDAELVASEIPQGNVEASGFVTEPNPEVPALASGIDGAVVEVPQGTDGGVAVLVEGAHTATNEALDARSLKFALEMTGCTDVDDLIDKATVGLSLLRAIDTHADLGPLQGWRPADDPAEVVGDLVNMASELQAQISALRAARLADVDGARPAYVNDKRRFILTGRTRQNNVLREIGETIDLSITEHAELLGTLAIASSWDEGFEV
ncbi:hypothetical protein [Rhizobium sp. Leaf341]|uniref:hypothetical protein n=1 Tax=Rhizobium sp. Leaf341 TaxID=1736344 RepID=UPI0012E3348A|nr:hypothetical protein [Rhizobium sp. Leaf341]